MEAMKGHITNIFQIRIFSFFSLIYNILWKDGFVLLGNNQDNESLRSENKRVFSLPNFLMIFYDFLLIQTKSML